MNVLYIFYKWISFKSTNQNGDPWFLSFSCIIVNLLSLECGLIFSWTSPVFPKLLTNEENTFDHIPTSTEISLIAAFVPLGAITGPIIAGICAQKLGRKTTLMAIAVPMIAGFFILAFARIVELYFLARFFLGLGIGGTFAVLPMYVAEITENHNRAKYGCYMGILITLGMFYPFAIGPHLTIPVYAMVSSLPAILFFIIFGIFMPESPHFLIAKGKQKETEEVLMKLRKKSVGQVQAELSEISLNNEKEQKENQGGFKELFTSQQARRAFFICLGLVIIQELSGIPPIIAYLKLIFQSVDNVQISPNISTVIFSLAQISSNLIIAFIVERIGRRVLYFISAGGCGLCCALLVYYIKNIIIEGIFFNLKSLEVDLKEYSWIPTVCLVGYMIFFSCGLGPLGWSIIGEIFPSNVKGIGSGLIVCVSFFASFIAVTLFPFLSEWASIATPFWLFTLVTIIGIVFIALKVPETRGMSLIEIQETLKRSKTASSNIAENSF